MKGTRQGDPSTPERALGLGYKAVMVAMYEQTFRTSFPFVLVRDHCSFHPNVSQTLVRPGDSSLPVVEVETFFCAASQGPIRFAGTK